VHGKRAFLKIFKDHRKELLAYSKRNHVRFRNNMDPALVQLVDYYCKINDPR
jgi:hypothetical protein